MEHMEDLARIDADLQDLLSSMKNGMGEVFVKVKDTLEVETRKNLAEISRLTQAQQAEMMSMKSMWEIERQRLLDKLRKVEEELVMVRDENKQCKQLLVERDFLEGGGDGRGARMDVSGTGGDISEDSLAASPGQLDGPAGAAGQLTRSEKKKLKRKLKRPLRRLKEEEKKKEKKKEKDMCEELRDLKVSGENERFEVKCREVEVMNDPSRKIEIGYNAGNILMMESASDASDDSVCIKMHIALAHILSNMFSKLFLEFHMIKVGYCARCRDRKKYISAEVTELLLELKESKNARSNVLL